MIHFEAIVLMFKIVGLPHQKNVIQDKYYEIEHSCFFADETIKSIKNFER